MTAWLLERVTAGGTISYLHNTQGAGVFTFSPYQAIRFCRRQDAATVRDSLPAGQDLRPVEHMFDN